MTSQFKRSPLEHYGSFTSFLILTGILYLFYLMALILNDETLSRLVNGSLPIAFSATCSWTGYKNLKSEPNMIWGPVPWFLGACILYYGIGPLVYSYGSPASIAYMASYYPVSVNDIVRTNMLNMFSIFLVGCFYQIARTFLDRTQNDFSSSPMTDHDLKWLLAVFLLFGLPIKYLIALPYHFGHLNWTLPGSIQFISTFTTLSIAILYVLLNQKRHIYRFLLYCLIISELFAAITTFSKTEVIMVVIIIMASRFYLSQNFKTLFFQAVTLVVLYAFILGPFVYFGRVFYSQFGVPNIKDLFFTISEFYQSDHDSEKEYTEIQGWWTRLSYVNAQVFAMHSYDENVEGNSFKYALFTVIPRFIFPEKPKMTFGTDFNALVTGNEMSKSAPGFFAESYWNGGWLYVVFACLVVGILFAIFSNVSIKYFSSRNLAILPVSFIGIRMGLQPDSWFVATYIGASIQAIAMYVLFVKLVVPMGKINDPSLRKIHD